MVTATISASGLVHIVVLLALVGGSGGPDSVVWGLSPSRIGLRPDDTLGNAGGVPEYSPLVYDL